MLNKKFFNMVIASILTLIIFCSPAAAGIAAMDIYKSSNKTLYLEEISASQKEKLVDQALSDPVIMRMVNEFASEYELTSTKEAKWVFKERTGYIGYLIFGKKDIDDWMVKILYAVDGDKIVKSGAFVKRSSNVIDVYDAVGNKIYNTSTATITEKEITITWKEGPLVPQSKDGLIQSTTVPIIQGFPPSGECEWCEFICNAIIGGGCGVTGALRCALICNANLACDVICGAIWALICVIGGAAADCGTNCVSWGYCP